MNKKNPTLHQFGRPPEYVGTNFEKEKFWNITPKTENIYIHMSKLVSDPSDTDKSCNSSNSRKHRVLLT